MVIFGFFFDLCGLVININPENLLVVELSKMNVMTRVCSKGWLNQSKAFLARLPACDAGENEISSLPW